VAGVLVVTNMCRMVTVHLMLAGMHGGCARLILLMLG
jgi:hypothetical protein